MREFHLYILASPSRTLYIGVTGNLASRLDVHQSKLVDGFTRDYNATMLVHLEAYASPRDAIAREKQLKYWSRAKKVALIERENPGWLDLAVG